MVSQSKYGFNKMVSQSKYGFNKMVSQSKYGKLYVSKSVTDSSKCASAADSSCFITIIECITSYDSSVWFKLIVYKVKYSICCFKTLRYLLFTIFICLSIYLFFFYFSHGFFKWYIVYK